MRAPLYTVYVIDGPEGSYVGCTSGGIRQRFRAHVSAAHQAAAGKIADSRFYRALRFHGASKFLVCVVARFDDAATAREYERQHLWHLDRLGLPLYNRICSGGGGVGRKAVAA